MFSNDVFLTAHQILQIGFYEEIADGGSVKFCPAEAIPHKVLEFLNVFCREHGNGHSFFKSDGNVNAMKAEIIVSLPHKQFYHFPQ